MSTRARVSRSNRVIAIDADGYGLLCSKNSHEHCWQCANKQKVNKKLSAERSKSTGQNCALTLHHVY